MSKIIHSFFLAIIFFLFTYEDGFQGNRTYVVYANGLLIIYSIILFIITLKSNRVKKTRLFYYFIYGTFFFLCLDLILSVFMNTESNLAMFVIQFSMISLFISFYKIFKSRFIDFISDIIILIGSISAIVALITLFTGTLYFGPLQVEGGFDKLLRIYGWYGSPNRLGSFIAVSILFLLHKFLNQKNISKINIAFFVFLIVPLLLTGSRGSIFSLIIASLILFPLKFEFKKLFFRIIPLFIVSLFIIGEVFDFYKFSRLDYYETILRTEQDEFSRIEINKNSLDFISQIPNSNLLFGSGSEYAIKALDRSTHNGFFSTLINNGILYLFFKISILIIIFFELNKKVMPLKKENKITRLFFISLLIFLLSREFINDLGMLTNGIYQLFFLFVATHLFIKNNENFISTR